MRRHGRARPRSGEPSPPGRRAQRADPAPARHDLGMRRDPLRASLAEQLAALRGDGATVPDALLDVVSQEVAGVTVIRPHDWDELRHVEGGEGRGVPYW